MTVAVDVDLGANAGGLEHYARKIVAALLSRDRVVERIILITNTDNHARFETLRDEHCDVAMVHRPLFEGRTVADWSSLLARHPNTGPELLSYHLHAKFRIIRDLAVDVVHFPDDPVQPMNLDAPMVISLHSPAPSASIAHAVIVKSDAHRRQLCHESNIPTAKVFVAVPPGQCSTNSPREADEDHDRRLRDFAASIREAYEHALASFQLKNAA